MKRSTALLAGSLVGAAVGYVAVARPALLRWGATWRERARLWPGDEFMPEPAVQSIRAVTIHAPARKVWPWIAQMGQDRGGFYSYTSLENLVGADMRNAREIHPEWQQREVGEKVWLGSPEKFDGEAYMMVARWLPGKCLVLVAPLDWDEIKQGRPATHSVWSFILEPISAQCCRLTARSLGGLAPTPGSKTAHYLFWEPAHFIMERGMMLGIKHRAEAPEPASIPRIILNAAVALAKRQWQKERTSAL